MTDEDENIGQIYILRNEAMPGLYKIGVTSRDDVNERIRELFTTSVPLPFTLEFACKVKDYKGVEKDIHTLISEHRIHDNREFFRIDPLHLKPLLKRLEIEETTKSINEEYNKTITPNDKEAITKFIQKRPKFKFNDMGIIAIPLNISVIMVSNVFVATGDAKCRFRWRSGG